MASSASPVIEQADQWGVCSEDPHSSQALSSFLSSPSPTSTESQPRVVETPKSHNQEIVTKLEKIYDDTQMLGLVLFGRKLEDNLTISTTRYVKMERRSLNTPSLMSQRWGNGGN